MIKKDCRLTKNGAVRTQIRVVEGYRPGPGLPPKQRTIKDFGCLEDQASPSDFMRMVEDFNATYKAKNIPLRIEAAGTAHMYSEENRRLNYGYRFLEAVYDMLEIDGFVEECLEKSHVAYSAAAIFKFLILARILTPDSKRATFQMKNFFYGFPTDFTLPDLYKALDVFAGFEAELQRHLNQRVKETIGRDISHAFYDVTNYFFEIDFPDGDYDLIRRGVSKEHRVDPIVAMGLFMDQNGLPVSMSIFPGNTADTRTLQPTMRDIKASYGLGRLVVVADKGLNSSSNIDAIVNAGDGFVFSQILKGTKGRRYAGKIFDENGWTENANGTYKYKLFEEDCPGLDREGQSVVRRRKVLLYWDKADADIARRKREEKLEKAARATKNAAYTIKKGQEEYLNEDYVIKGTGEYIGHDKVKKLRSVNTEKAEADALYDGYFCIITSELSYDERKMREVYGGLWRIEESFRMLKSDLYARPVFVRKNEHIRAHFLICFVALLILRIIQHRMGRDVLSAERIARALNAATCRVFKGGIVHLDDVGGAIAFKKRINKKGEAVDTLQYSDDDEIALDYKAIQKTFNTDFYAIFQRQEAFNKFLKNIALA